MRAASLLVGFLLAALAVAPASAQRSRIDWEMADALASEVVSCPAAQMAPEARPRARAMHVPDQEGYVARQLELMLRTPTSTCPGVAASAASRLRALVGEPERPDSSVRLLRLARAAAEEGLGMAPDPVLAARLTRIEWLFGHDTRTLPRWDEAEAQAWLARPEITALLEARVAANRHAQRQVRILAELRLRRDVSGYDPERALALFEQAVEHERYAEVLSDGVHLPVDYRRAFTPMFRLGMFDLFDQRQRVILRIGRQAAATARTPAQRAEALRILFAGSIDDLDGSCALLPPLLRAFEAAPLAPLAADDARRIRENLSDDYRPFMISDDPPNPGPVVLRALIDPTGRVVYARLRRSSGSRDRDHIALRAWARSAEQVDLSATARGRFVWADLAPIEPERTTTMPPRPTPRPSCL